VSVNEADVRRALLDLSDLIRLEPDPIRRVLLYESLLHEGSDIAAVGKGSAMLDLADEGWSQEAIAEAVGHTKDTVRRYLYRAAETMHRRVPRMKRPLREFRAVPFRTTQPR